MEKKINQVVGASFEELDAEDMKQTQGAGDVDAEAIPASVIVSLSATVSATVSPVSPVMVSVKKC